MKKIIVLLLGLLFVGLVAGQMSQNMALIPGGSFQMGDSFNEENGRLTQIFYVSAFYMDQTEVTKAHWNEVQAWALNHGYDLLIGNGKATNHPVQNVNWYDAVKWCNARSEKEGRVAAYYIDATHTAVYRMGQVDVDSSWVKWNTGYRLPTEAEWEKAARGGRNEQRFPWLDSNIITHERANYFSSTNNSYDVSSTRGFHPNFQSIGFPYTSPVRYFTSNSYGLYDMAGNVSEWCWNWYDTHFDSSQINPRGPTSGWLRPFRGGGWGSRSENCRVAGLNGSTPDFKNSGVGLRCVLPSPATDSIQLIETQPDQPIFTPPPAKEERKDSLVVVTHGWQPSWKPVDIGWVETMTNAISSYLSNKGTSGWQVHAHRWGEKSRLLSLALHNSEEEGKRLGGHLASSNLRRIHLIGHSAGSALIQAAAETIKASRPDIVVHLTFLDPYVGVLYRGRSKYGESANWADNYFSRDSDTILTHKILPHAYNVDVTWLDSTTQPIIVSYSTPSGAVSQNCQQIVSSHGWPHDFYLKTITESWSATQGLGFPLSQEGGNWNSAIDQYDVGNNPSQVLGNGELVCPLVISPLTAPVYTGPSLDFLKLPETSVIRNDPAKIDLRGTGLKLVTGSPAWIVVEIPITNRINFVSFEAEFVSTNRAEGLLSVYWGTNVVGSVDERVAPSGLRGYTFPVLEASTGTQTLGLRLDAFSATQSSATVTNVALGFTGLREPFSLSIGNILTNGVLTFQLVGPPGFNYRVESSTNLTDWSTIAILVNTNSVVNFVDPSSFTNRRFYRAVTP